jgi:hypothetical protein
VQVSVAVAQRTYNLEPRDSNPENVTIYSTVYSVFSSVSRHENATRQTVIGNGPILPFVYLHIIFNHFYIAISAMNFTQSIVIK